VSKNLDGIIQSWNAGAERLFGYTATEVVGKPINILIPPQLQDEETEILHVFGAASASSITKLSVGGRMEAWLTFR